MAPQRPTGRGSNGRDEVRQAHLDPAEGDEVVVSVPADTRFLHVLRTAAAAASLGTMPTLREVDSLRLALGELAATCLDVAAAHSRVTVRIRVARDRLRVDGHVPTNGLQPRLTGIATTVVDEVSTSHWLHVDGDDAVFGFAVDNVR